MKAPRLIPFLWGWAEATFFFIVPDVWLTVLAARENTKILWRAIGWTVLGSLIGGVSMYVVGRILPPLASSILSMVPGINVLLMLSTVSQVGEHGLVSMGLGMFTGVPYKIYAAAWGFLHGNFLQFCIATVFFRCLRFAVVGFLVKIIFVSLKKVRVSDRTKMAILVVCWAVFYVFYFQYMLSSLNLSHSQENYF